MTQDTVNVGQIGSNDSNLKNYTNPTIFSAIPHYLPLGIYPLIFLAAVYGGWWLIPAFVFMSLTGLFDKWLGVDGKSIDPYKTTEKGLFWHNLPVWIWAFMWPVTLIFGMWMILMSDHLSTWECIVLAMILAMEAQAVFVIGHELIHRRVVWERRLGEFLLASASYPTYATEHVYIHHAKVGTPYDVGSAPRGESFWHYLPKELISNITNSWALDKDRLARRGLPVWHYTNPFWRYGTGILFWHGLAYLMGGIWAIPIFAFLGFGCVFSMKISNYLQHYGLRRVLLPSGRWEKVAPRHSWSADFKFSNWMFFNMQRHADHHATASRHYPLLQVRGPEESPELPGTYADMMNIVLRPSKWFEKMDPLVQQWREHFYPDMDDWSAYDSPVAMSRPDDFPLIVEIFGASPRLAKWTESHPKLLDSLNSREFIDLDLPKGFDADPEVDSIVRKGLARVYWTYEMNVHEMKERIGEWPAADANETALIVQGWSNEKAFQIGMHVVRGNLTPSEASKAYSNLAEASIAMVLEAVVADFEERVGPLPLSIAAVFLNDFATGNVQLGSKLDLIFIHDNKDHVMCNRVCQRFNEVLSILASDSLLLDQPAAQSNVAKYIPITELDEYCHNTEQALAILTKSRCIYQNGTTDMEKLFVEERNRLLAEESVVDPVIADLNYAEFGQEDISINLRIKTIVNGIDKATRYLELTKGGQTAEDNALASETVLAKFNNEELSQKSTAWRELLGAVTLAGDDDVEAYSSSVKSLVAKNCGYADFEALKNMIDEQVATTKELVQSIY